MQKTISLLGRSDSIAHEPGLLKEFRHPRIVEVWEAQWDPDPAMRPLEQVTFVMPYYQGGSVADALADGRQFSVGTAVNIACQALEALEYVHTEHRVVHRDVKPGNVFLDADFATAHLGDFGSAARLDDRGTTAAHGLTRIYTPPEAHLGRYSVLGDIYEMGLTLLELLNGPFPYADMPVPPIDRRLAVGRRAMPDRMLIHGPHVPPRLARAVNKMIAVDPGARPATAWAAQRSLERCRHLDWIPLDMAGGVAEWRGRWPMGSRPGQGREYVVAATPVLRGPSRGQVEVTARWRNADTLAWRAFRSVERRVPIEELMPAVAGVMRAVESRAM